MLIVNPFHYAPQQMRDKSRNDCQSLVFAQKCVCQTPPPCAGVSPKGSPQKGELLAHHMVCPQLTGLFNRVGDPVGQKACFAPCSYPLKLSHPLCCVG